MILISQKECEALVKMGFKFQKDLHKTTGKGKKTTYYATESKAIKEAVSNMR